MSSRWPIAAAKAEFSRLVRAARRAPQVLESRGKAVAVVLDIADYQRLVDDDESAARWRAFLDLSAQIRAEGGVNLPMSRRRPRRSPFGR